jgi:adenosylcobinamide kinase/adenosylcobinamide-phosphate guanylyltransferase
LEGRRIVLVGGGVRSGKSSFATDQALRLGERRAFVATATASDPEMTARIERHRRDRGNAFATFEAPLALPETLATLDGYDVVVVDCLTHWISNLLLDKRPLQGILDATDAAVRVLQQRRFHSVLVTNEVGMSVHPPTEVGRAFVEACGWAHQRVARAADEVHLAVLGTVVRIRGGPGDRPFHGASER